MGSKIVAVKQPDGKDAHFIEGAEKQLVILELDNGKDAYAVLDYKKLGYMIVERKPNG